MRGRKPKPTWLKIVAGNPGRHPINDAEPIPVGEIGDPPEYFTATQRLLWASALKGAPPGLLKLLDASVLELWCVHKDGHRIASEEMARLGAVVKAARTGRPIKNPYVTVAREHAAIVLKCISEMGFSPSSRSRVKVEKPKGGADEFGDLKEF